MVLLPALHGTGAVSMLHTFVILGRVTMWGNKDQETTSPKSYGDNVKAKNLNFFL